MHDIDGMIYNRVTLCPTFQEPVMCEYYLAKYPDRSATFTRCYSLLTRVDGIGMMLLEEQERREIVERQGWHDQTDRRHYWAICADAQSYEPKSV